MPTKIEFCHPCKFLVVYETPIKSDEYLCFYPSKNYGDGNSDGIFEIIVARRIGTKDILPDWCPLPKEERE